MVRSRTACWTLSLRSLPKELEEDYNDGMCDTLLMYPSEEKLPGFSGGLQNTNLINKARTGLTNALARVQATDDKVNVMKGGGE